MRLGTIVKGAGVTSSVWPSGADFATISVPITVLPPARLSTSTGCPHISFSFWADHAPDDVGAAAGCKRHDAAGRLGRVALRCARAAAHIADQQ